MKHLFLITLLTSSVVAGAAYAGAGYGFRECLMPNTMVNGYDLSLLERGKVNETLSDFTRQRYELNVTDIHGNEVVISAYEIGLSCDYPVEKIEKQNSYLWPKYLGSSESYELKPVVSYDEKKLRELINSRVIGTNETEIPRDAFLTGYVPGAGYVISKERDGDTADLDRVFNTLDKAIRSLEKRVDLLDSGCYLTASVRRDDNSLKREADEKNRELSSCIVYDLGDHKLKLNSDIYYNWIGKDDNGELSFDDEKMDEYITSMKKSTDTAYSERAFRTVNGQTINLTGPYGFSIDKKSELEQLSEDLRSGQKVEREPVYKTTGVTRDGNDYGENYVEVDLTNQKVYLIKEGKVALTTDCVTGNTSLNRSTPPGIYSITFKTTNAILRGPGYASHVNYWMPFNGGIGLHDALWRGSFGGQIYRNSGSHGCVNLPYSAAKELYGQVERGFPVICHY